MIRRLLKLRWNFISLLLIAWGFNSISASAAPSEEAPEPLIIFAAASLTDVLETHASKWAEQTGRPKPRLSFGPSATMARQIVAGAPADIMISANPRWVDLLGQKGRLEGPAHTVAGNRLVLTVPGRHENIQAGALDAAILLAIVGDGKLAMADPATAPAGEYARQTLENLGVWTSLQPHLAFGGSVRQILLLVERGGMPGFVYQSDALASRRATIVATVPASLHDPIEYRAGIIEGSAAEAQEFVAYLMSPSAGEDWTGFGFKPPQTGAAVPN